MSRAASARLNLTQLKKQAKEILKAHHAGDPDASPVLRRLPRFAAAMAPEILAAEVTLADVQFARALEHGFDSWAGLKRCIEGNEPRPQAQLKYQDGAAWITRVPKIGWGLDRDCTFIGALEAALAPTEYSWNYADLMGFSGLAFRIRWSPTFCPSCAVGELPDEGDGIGRCTGIAFPTDTQFGQERPDREPIRRRIVASVDAGRPVIAYGLCMDVSVVYGYEDSGRTLWLTDYHAKGVMPCKLPLAKLGPWQAYPENTGAVPSPAEQLRLALTLATTNWQHREHDGGLRGRKYFYGQTAYEAWLGDIHEAEKLSADQLKQIHHTHRFVGMTFADARQAAARFLGNYAQFATGRAADAISAASTISAGLAKQVYRAFNEQQLFSGPLETWTSEKRQAEQALIETARQQDALLHREIQTALSAITT